MNPVKRLGLAVALVGGVALFAGTPAWAEDWGTAQLTNVGDEPQATGQATLKKVGYVATWDSRGILWPGSGYIYETYSGTLSVKFQNLTPGATYWTPAGTFTADRKGAGGVTRRDLWFDIGFDVIGWGWENQQWVFVAPYVVEVVRLDPDGAGTPVLSGFFVPPGAEYPPPDWYYLLVGCGELP